jgi:CRP-like cAMP-binding protein
MSPRENQILGALSPSEYKRLLPQFEFVLMPQGSFISRPNEIQPHVYFPATSLFAVYTVSEDQILTGMALVGNEGLGCPAVILGMQSASNYAMVIGAGYGYRMTVEAIREELASDSELLALSLHFTNAFMFQISQTIVCNQHHTLYKQLCSWLLMCADRWASAELPLKLGFIGDMLGARRTTMSLAIGHLQEQGAIHHSRGKLTLLNRHKLEEGACSCHKIVQKEYQRLLSAD